MFQFGSIFSRIHSFDWSMVHGPWSMDLGLNCSFICQKTIHLFRFFFLLAEIFSIFFLHLLVCYYSTVPPMFNIISLRMNKGKTLIIIDYRLYRENVWKFFFIPAHTIYFEICFWNHQNRGINVKISLLYVAYLMTIVHR